MVSTTSIGRIYCGGFKEERGARGRDGARPRRGQPAGSLLVCTESECVPQRAADFFRQTELGQPDVRNCPRAESFPGFQLHVKY
jgi:hypothetical protein